MVNANNFHGKNDSETLNLTIANRDEDGTVLIPPRKSDIDPERSWWLLDEAVLLPENTTVILRNCKLKLSDACRDNFFRTANSGLGIVDPAPITNVHLRGEGFCLLEGADHPRATGDGTKPLANPCPYEVKDLIAMADWIPPERRSEEAISFWDRHTYSYGTDADKPGESHYGDWRGIGVLFANVTNFSVSGICIRESHGWGISLEACSFGRVENITFDACMSKMIDGLRSNIENQDGIDIRNGCHDIVIRDVFGETGDDVIALTAIASDVFHPGGSFEYTHVMHSDWSRRDKNIHNIQISNVQAYSDLCYCVRLLPMQAHIWNVTIDHIIDTCPDNHTHFGTILIGEYYGGTSEENSVRALTVSDVICRANSGLDISAYLLDSCISDVVNMRPGTPTLRIRPKNKDKLQNVTIGNIVESKG